MDVWGVFVGDTTLSYGGSVRSTYYRDYEQFPYGTLEHNGNSYSKDPYSRMQEKSKKIKSERDLRKECPFCKEHKKRPLINYLRKRDSRKHHESICEDEEEHEHIDVTIESESGEEEAHEQQQQQQANTAKTTDSANTAMAALFK